MFETRPAPSSLLNYEYSEQTRIHTMTFHAATREAYDEFLRIMTHIYKGVTLNDQVRVLVDYRQSGIPPIHYLIPKSLAWTRTLSIHPEARLAVVTRSDPISRILRSTISTVRFGHLSTGIFDGETGYQRAVEWLQL